ncbi:MAG: methylmalonyl-CoA carboxyltransferase, partial [Proteobacteria bacterium]|nr:methylmalonyl-CoA carboxyltransferase [Pseudomonadota bacterium]
MNRIEDLLKKKKAIIDSPGPERTAKVFHEKGMLSPRERIDLLLDPGSFFELDMLATHHYQEFGMSEKQIPAEGVITGFGDVGGRKVCVYAQDFSALGGTYGEMHGRKICALMDTAAEAGVPVI